MKFGVEKKNELAASTRPGDYIRNFKAGDTTIRFLSETDDFFGYREHYSPEGKSYPCLQDSPNCPGCNSEIESERRASRKYAANVLMPETGYVYVFKMPVTLVNRLVTRSERNGGTIIDRDYIISRSGKGLETEYDVDPGDRYVVDVDSYGQHLKDINKMLQQSFEEAWGPISDYDGSSKTKAEAKVEETKVDDIPPSKKAVEKNNAAVVEVIDEATVRDMDLSKLIKLSAEAGVDITNVETREQIIDVLLAELS